MLRTVASPGTFGCHDLGRLGKYELVPKKTPFLGYTKKVQKKYKNYTLFFGVSHTTYHNFFFCLLTGFPPGFGVSEIGVYHENDPRKKKFLPEKAVVARFARASLADTGREAKRVGGATKIFFGKG